MLKNPSTKKYVQLILILMLVFSYGCSEPESSARKLYNEGMTLQQSGDNEQAVIIYKELVASYPSTETAVEVNKILLSINLIQTSTKDIKTKARILSNNLDSAIKEDIRLSLDLFKLDNGRYPSTEEGLQALSYNPPGFRHWKGPYIKSQSTINAFQNYNYENNRNNGGVIVLEIK